MTTSILRTTDGWWVQTADGAARIDTLAATTGELLTDRPAIDAAVHSAHTVPVDRLRLISPVTVPCRVVAQMTNFASRQPPEAKFAAFLIREACNPKYLRHGDVLELSIATNDGAIDLGTQRTAVRFA